MFYLAGLRLRAPYLRWLGTSLFGVEALRLLVSDMWACRPIDGCRWRRWMPWSSMRTARCTPRTSSTATPAAAAVALVIGGKSPEPYRSVAWQAAAAGAFAFGWWRRLFDFRLQGYCCWRWGWRELRRDARTAARGSGRDLLCGGAVRVVVRRGSFCGRANAAWCGWAAPGVAVAALMALVWRLAPGEYLGVGWMAMAVLVLELGMRRMPDDFRRMAYAAAAMGAVRVWLFNEAGLHNSGPLDLRLMPLRAALLAYAIAVRARREEGGMLLIGASSVGLAFAVVALWALLPRRWSRRHGRRRRWRCCWRSGSGSARYLAGRAALWRGWRTFLSMVNLAE